jgi:hypothetical protein
MYLQRLLLAIWIFGLIGVAAELLLLEHYEDIRQAIPLAMLALGLGVGSWFGWRPSVASERAFQVILVLFVLSGLTGVVLHFLGNLEFERERDASIGGLRLIWRVLTGATPALSPGTMILFGVIGYALLVARRPHPT